MKLRHAGFTLVELLVVVAIIIILIAILVPSLSRAMSAAQTAKCLSSQRHWGKAVKEYTLENKSAAPDLDAEEEREGAEWEGKRYKGMWMYLFAPYVGEDSFDNPDGVTTGNVYAYGPSGGYYADPQVDENDPTNSDPNTGVYGNPGGAGKRDDVPYHYPLESLICPSTNFNLDAANSGGGNASRAWSQFHTWGSYAINMWAMSYDYYWSWEEQSGHQEKFFGTYTNVSGDVPIIAGSNWVDTWPDPITPGLNHPPNSVKQGGTWPPIQRVVLARHGTAINLGYADGSAATVPLGEIWMQHWHNVNRRNSDYLRHFDKY